MLVKATIFGQHTVSRQYRCTACIPLQFFTKKIGIQKARVGVLCPVNRSCLITFYYALYINRAIKLPFSIKAFGDFIGTVWETKGKSMIMLQYRVK